MITHLHLYLEPNERKRRQIGVSRQEYSDAESFFTEHRLDNPRRLSVEWEDILSFMSAVHSEQREQGVSYAELRLSPRRLARDERELQMLLGLLDSAVAKYSSPTIRLILLINRDSPAGYIRSFENVIESEVPQVIVGVDLAGDERRYPDVRKFSNLFSLARGAGLGLTVHAGEFGGAEHIWRALDELGADRVGHGVSAGGQGSLADRLTKDDILLEMSLTSNITLGSVPDLESHPLPWLIERGVPVCLNSDVPLHLGTTLADEYAMARLLLGNNSEALNLLEGSAGRHRFFSS